MKSYSGNIRHPQDGFLVQFPCLIGIWKFFCVMRKTRKLREDPFSITAY